MGFVSDKYSPDFYCLHNRVPKLTLDENPTFVIYGDSRPGLRSLEKFLREDNWNTQKMCIFPLYQLYWLRNGIIGGVEDYNYHTEYGLKKRRMVRDAIVAEARRSQIDFVLHLGDLIIDGRYPNHWEIFLRENRIESSLLDSIPYLVMVGNHEHANDKTYGLPNYEAIFNLPQFYVVDSPDAAIFVLDSDVIIDQYQDIPDNKQDEMFAKWIVSDDIENPAWLEQELKKRNKTFNVICLHHPLFSFAKHHKDWYKPEYGRNLLEKRRKFIELLQKHDVQLVLSSHDHLYQHNLLRYKKDGSEKEMHVIISGGGGVPLRKGPNDEIYQNYVKKYQEEGFDVTTINWKKIYHYCRVEITSDKIEMRVFQVESDKNEADNLVEKIIIRKNSK